MNAAAAISAADSTLRDGRNAALRNPSFAIGSVPRPRIGLGHHAQETDGDEPDAERNENSRANDPFLYVWFHQDFG